MIYKILTYLIAAVWIINGLFCKVLNLVPRHKEIVGRILGQEFSDTLTIMIGLAEILMAIWVISGIRSKLNATIQIIIVTVMNILEFILVPDLLLWGKLNSIFALLFVVIVYCNEFVWKDKCTHQSLGT